MMNEEGTMKEDNKEDTMYEDEKTTLHRELCNSAKLI